MTLRAHTAGEFDIFGHWGTPLRTYAGNWKARPKPHLRLFRINGVLHWQALALGSGGCPYCAYAETALEACSQVLGGQRDFWDGRQL